MFYGLQPIQIFNAIVNALSMFLILPVLISILNYKRRTQKRFDQIERHLDNILLLSHELYQSDVKEKGNDQDTSQTISGKTTPKKTGGIKL